MMWPLKQLCEVASINPKFDAKNTRDDNIVSFVPMAAVSETSGQVTREEDRPLADVIKGFTPFLNGDLLVAKITPCFENGKIALAQLSREVGFGSTEFHVIRPFPDVMDVRYVYHFLRQPIVRQEGRARMTGSAGQRRVPRAFIEGLRIPVPPLPEQKRLAALLDQANTTRRKRQEAITKLDTLLQSVFINMFGDPTTNPKGWPLVQLQEVATINPPYNPRNNSGSTGKVSFVPMSSVSEITGTVVAEEERDTTDILKGYTPFQQGDILLAKITPCFENGKIALATIKNQFGYGSTEFYVIRPSENLDTHYAFHFLRRPMVRIEGERRMTGSAGQRRVPRHFIETLTFPLPPISEQKRFATCAIDVMKLRAKSTLELEKLNLLFYALESQTFGVHVEKGNLEKTCLTLGF